MRNNGPMPPADVDPRLGVVLRRLRGKTSQQVIASRAGITTGAYARIEKVADPPDAAGNYPPRTNPTWTTLLAICEAYEITISTLAKLVEAERG
jgi:transcriptional regulator with XRE-family HTH domain